MDDNIENLISPKLKVDFVPTNEYSCKTLRIPPFASVLFQDRFDVGGTFLEQALTTYAPVVIENHTKEDQKDYKPIDIGKKHP